MTSLTEEPPKDHLDIKMEEVHPDISPGISSGLIESGNNELPRVQVHEVDQLLAGIESEQDLTARSGALNVDHFPNLQSSSMHPTHQHQSVIVQSSMDPLQSALKPPLMSVKSPVLSPTGQQYQDPFKAVFGEDIEDSRGLGSFAPKIDPQKQLKKWETDEKLGEDATISPVLYANVVHREELMSKYKGLFVCLFIMGSNSRQLFSGYFLRIQVHISAYIFN